MHVTIEHKIGRKSFDKLFGIIPINHRTIYPVIVTIIFDAKEREIIERTKLQGQVIWESPQFYGVDKITNRIAPKTWSIRVLNFLSTTKDPSNSCTIFEAMTPAKGTEIEARFQEALLKFKDVLVQSDKPVERKKSFEL